MDSEALGIATLSSHTRSFSPTVVRLQSRGLGPYAGNISPSAKLPRPVCLLLLTTDTPIHSQYIYQTYD